MVEEGDRNYYYSKIEDRESENLYL